MSSEINWKAKYEKLKAKYLEDLDMAFRLGHEQGQQEATMDAMAQQQQQQADEMAAQTGMQGEQGQEGEEQPQEEPAVSQNPQGSELDKHINELESMLKSGHADSAEVQNVLNAIKNIRVQQFNELQLKKSAQAINGIAKALHKPKFKVSQQANHNLSNSAKKAVNMQQEIVENVMKSWAEEEKRAGKDILSQLGVEGILKKG